MEPQTLTISINDDLIKGNIIYNVNYTEFNDIAYENQLFEITKTPEIFGIFLN